MAKTRSARFGFAASSLVLIALAAFQLGCPPQEQTETTPPPPPPPPPPPIIEWPAQGVPVANLTPAAQLAEAPPSPVVGSAGGMIFAVGPDGLVAYTPGDQIPVQTRALPPLGRIANLRPEGVQFTRELLLAGERNTVVAVDVRTGQVRWRSEVHDASVQDVTPRSVAEVGNTIVLAVYSLAGGNEKIVALDPQSGAVRWQAATEAKKIAADDQRVYALAADGGIRALGINDGVELWFQRGPRGSRAQLVMPSAIAVSEGRLLVGNASGMLRVYDVATGAQGQQQRIIENGRVLALELTGSTMLAVVETIAADQTRRIRVMNIDPAALTARWSAPEVPTLRADTVTRTTVSDDAIYACTPDGVLRGIDPATGGILWEWGVGLCGTYAVMQPRPNAAPIVLAPVGDMGVVVFARANSETPIERATIRGRVTAPTPGPYAVRVGPSLVQSQPDGTFEVQLEARGLISVEAQAGAGTATGSTFVRLTGSGGPYDAQIQVQ